MTINFYIFDNLVNGDMRKILAINEEEARKVLKLWCKNMGSEYKNWIFVGESEFDS